MRVPQGWLTSETNRGPCRGESPLTGFASLNPSYEIRKFCGSNLPSCSRRRYSQGCAGGKSDGFRACADDSLPWFDGAARVAERSGVDR